jgi:hypothetical protein
VLLASPPIVVLLCKGASDSDMYWSERPDARNTFMPPAGTFESTAAYSLAVAVTGLGLLLWWAPMAFLYGISAILLGRFALRRIRIFELRGKKSAQTGQLLGWWVLGLSVIVGTASAML